MTGDEVESWDISEGDLESWKQLFKDRDRSLFDYVIDGLDDLDDCEEDPDDEEGDTKWTMQLVEPTMRATRRFSRRSPTGNRN